MSAKCGVSQGSVIRPLLFLIYINNITQVSSFATTMFADDIDLHMSASSIKTLQSKVKDELQHIDYRNREKKVSIICNKLYFIVLNRLNYEIATFTVIPVLL